MQGAFVQVVSVQEGGLCSGEGSDQEGVSG